MKLLHLRFANLNSLTGQWLIDFTDPAFQDAGLFAMTGPTGAGKSTLLDAMTLALFGQTPRLSRISKTSNEVMSRQMGECFAELAFQTDAGQFMVHWSQRRARKSPQGELQNPKHELIALPGGKVLYNKLRDVTEHVEQLTGMNFEQFTRAVLLAQGSFAAFLNASADERAPMLEQITGTQLYSEISKQVFEAHKTAKLDYEQAKAKLDDQPNLLDEQSLQTLTVRHSELTRSIQTHKQSLEAQRQTITTIQAAKAADERFKQTVQTLSQTQTQWQAFQPTLSAAKQAEQRHALRQQWQQIEGLEASRRKHVNDRLENETRRQQSEQQLADINRQQQIATNALEQHSAALAQLQPKRASAVEIEASLIELRGRFAAEGQQLKQATQTAQEQRRVIDNTQQQLNHATVQLKTAQAALAKLSFAAEVFERDDSIAPSITERRLLKSQLTEQANERLSFEHQLSESASQQQQLEATLRSIDTERQQAQQAIQVIEADIAELGIGEDESSLYTEQAKWQRQAEFAQRHARLQQTLTQSLNDAADTEKSLLAHEAAIKTAEAERHTQAKLVDACWRVWSLQQKVESLESERQRLVAGEPCPLCGALEHPLAGGDGLAADAAQQDYQNAKLALEQASEALKQLELTKGRQIANLEQFKRVIQQTETELASLDTALAPLGVRDVDEIGKTLQRLDQTLVTLKAARHKQQSLQSALNEHEKAYISAEQQRNNTINQQSAIKAQLDKLGSSQTHMQNQLSTIEASLAAALTVDLSALATAIDDYQTKRPQYQQARRQHADAEQLSAKLTDRQETAQKQLADVEASIAALNQSQSDLKQQGESQAALLKQTIGFESVAAFDQHWRETIDGARLQLNEIDKQRVDLRTQRDGLQHQIALATQQIEQLDAQIAPLRTVFDSAMAEANIANVATLLGDIMEIDAIASVLSQATEFEQRIAELTIRRAQLQEQLEPLQAQVAQIGHLNALAAALATDEQHLSNLTRDLNQIEFRLEAHTRAVVTQTAQREALNALLERYIQWGNLNELIGSADGKKYRNFAQGLTFEWVVSGANRQLRKMSDRYSLQRNHNEPLELDIVDHYQADERRSTKNLSGGESFLVSLCLALGLAQTTQHQRRVDALFLDEGFGTLDEDALDLALTTLGSLQQDGKLIGIISHVETLKQRIPVQINVQPIGGGRSQLSGPGVSRVAGD
ncbi:MAG: hypothetical protein HWE20_13490 [Gammaproteobacteria bacterium]|nr:hypothetical protein [Gammaproteobacteria bacterium]